MDLQITILPIFIRMKPTPRRLLKQQYNVMIIMSAFVGMHSSICTLRANEQDTLQFIAAVNKIYDDNLFRQRTNESSDQAVISTLGVRFDKSYALQRFIADVSYVDNKYQKNDYLNYVATNYKAAWQWSLTPGFTGILSTAKTERQINFRDLQSTVKNIISTTENTFRAEYSPFRVLSIIGGYTEITSDNSQQFNAQASNRNMGVDYGVKYNFPSESYIALMGHQRQGDVRGRPLNAALQFDTGFTDNQYSLEFEKRQAGKSILSGDLGYVERLHDNFSSRDYRLLIGKLSYELLLTGKLKSNFNLARNVGAFETNNSTYTKTDAIDAGLNYEVSDKIQAGLNFRFSERSFEGRGQFDTSGRVDKEHSYGASISWRPIRNIGFSIITTKSNRNSSVAQFDFDDMFTSINVDLKI